MSMLAASLGQLCRLQTRPEQRTWRRVEHDPGACSFCARNPSIWSRRIDHHIGDVLVHQMAWRFMADPVQPPRTCLIDLL